MTHDADPTLQLQKDLDHLPFGGAWWPTARGVSHELLDLIARWPTSGASVAGYAYLPVDWDNGSKDSTAVEPPADGAPAPLRTRTLLLRLSDHSSCRIVVIPPETPGDVAQRLLAEATDPLSTWRRSDYDGALRAPVTPVSQR